MAKPGPKARPDHLKAVAGVEERYRNRNEPQPAAPTEIDLKVPPRGLGAAASKVWRRLAPDLVDKRVLTVWDMDAFVAYCIAAAQYDAARKLVQRQGMTAVGSQGQLVVSPNYRVQTAALGQLLQLASRFGLTPGDRASIEVAPPLQGGGGPAGPTNLGPERLLS